MHRSIAYCGTSQIPLPKNYTSTARLSSGSGSSSPVSTTPKNVLSPRQSLNGLDLADNSERWKIKYEEAERKRKQLLAKSEKGIRDYADLERRYRHLSDEHNLTRNELKDKDVQLLSLRNVSEKVYKEYDTLKNQYEVETGAMHKAMQHAGEWYKQNRQLKRQSTVLIQKYLQMKPNGIVDININDVTDSNSEGYDDLEGLRNTVTEMSKQIAALQAELNATKLQEFEATEQCINMSQELEQERDLRLQCEQELDNLRQSRDHLAHVSRLVAEEVAVLKHAAERDRQTAENLEVTARKAMRERDVLARQSAMLVGELGPEERVLLLLQEVGDLKNALELERQDHASQVADLLEKLEDRETDSQMEILEEKLKLAEYDLQTALNRAELAEKQLEIQELLNINDDSQMPSELDNLSINNDSNLPPNVPLPPLPPPPPPPPMLNLIANDCKTIKFKSSGTALNDMAKILGIQESGATKKTIPQNGGAIDDIINEIKGGRFQLRSTEPKPIQKTREEPAAVKEMLNILGTLRRRPRSIKPSLAVASLADVQL